MLFALGTGLARSPRPQLCAAALPVVTFVNPLEVDGFAEPGGWGTHEDPTALPLLVFLPGMDGSLCTPFMQYPELGTVFELSCMRATDGMASRATFDDLSEACAGALPKPAAADDSGGGKKKKRKSRAAEKRRKYKLAMEALERRKKADAAKEKMKAAKAAGKSNKKKRKRKRKKKSEL